MTSSANTNQNEGATQTPTLQPQPPALTEEASVPQNSQPVFQPNVLAPNRSFGAPLDSFNDPFFPPQSSILQPQPPALIEETSVPQNSQPVFQPNFLAPNLSFGATLESFSDRFFPPHSLANAAFIRFDPARERIQRYQEFVAEQRRQEIEFFRREGWFPELQNASAEPGQEPVSNGGWNPKENRAGRRGAGRAGRWAVWLMCRPAPRPREQYDHWGLFAAPFGIIASAISTAYRQQWWTHGEQHGERKCLGSVCWQKGRTLIHEFQLNQLRQATP
jgi:hypothetical protein